MDIARVVSNENIKGTSRSKGLIASIILMILLLSMRDIGGMAVNKYLFLIITAAVVFVLPIDKVMCFIAFVMPLYVGLPGNYMTLIFLARFLFDYRKLRMKATTFTFCMLAGGFALVQAVLTNHTGISELIFFPGMVLVMFMFSVDAKMNKSQLILSYVTGVAALGLIMLIHTLQFCDFGDLLISTSRLGSILRAKNFEMVVNVDPNYYGLFCIAAVSSAINHLNANAKEETNKLTKFLIIIMLAICVTVSLIGLSRAFILVAIAWLIFYLLSAKKIKTSIITLFSLFLVIVLINLLMPSVFTALIERFTDDTMSTGNGRTELIYSYHQQWAENIFTILFGSGIFDCEVHCMPLQMLYGGGIVFAILYLSYLLSPAKNIDFKKNGGALQTLLPLLATILMSCSVPALQLINIMYPIIFTELYINENRSNEPINRNSGVIK